MTLESKKFAGPVLCVPKNKEKKTQTIHRSTEFRGRLLLAFFLAFRAPAWLFRANWRLLITAPMDIPGECVQSCNDLVLLIECGFVSWTRGGVPTSHRRVSEIGRISNLCHHVKFAEASSNWVTRQFWTPVDKRWTKFRVPGQALDNIWTTNWKRSSVLHHHHKWLNLSLPYKKASNSDDFLLFDSSWLATLVGDDVLTRRDTDSGLLIAARRDRVSWVADCFFLFWIWRAYDWFVVRRS